MGGSNIMGTRNLTVVVKDGQIRVAQYGQWDGYPEGQGMTIVEFLMGHRNVELLSKRLDSVRFSSEDEDFTVYETLHGALPPEFSRDTAGKILEHIVNTDYFMWLPDNREFAADALFCEWAYVVDLDKSVLEVYKGFGKASPGERFYPLQEQHGINDKYGTAYGAVRFVTEFRFDELNPKTFVDKIKAALGETEDEE